MNLNISTIEEFQNRFGSPLYIFDEDSFIRNYQHFNECFKSVYSNYQLSYSYKTNYAPYICRIVKRLGGYAEVVSDMELRIAKSIGYKASEIIYNGPSKGPFSAKHILDGGILNIDNFEELDRISQLAKSMPDKLLKIGVRVNIDIGQSFVSRFGIDECDLDQFFLEASCVANLYVSGIHCHVGRCRSLEAWQNRAARMISIADRYFTDIPDYISLGSGMFGEMAPELANQFTNCIPTFEEYAQATAASFAEHFKGEKKPILLTEPGTTLVNRYIDFVATVESIKHIKGQTFLVLNSSKHNLGEICELKNLPLTVIRAGTDVQSVKNAKLVGYTCLEHDVLYRDFSGDIAVGDYIVFGNIGGYSNVSKPPFIRPNCAMVSLNGALIKRAETFEEILKTYE